VNATLPRARRVSTRTAVLPAHGRSHNLSLVLQLLYSLGAMSRADLARRLGMSKVTVSDLVAELIDSGHAVELGPSDVVRPGKPGTLVDVNRTGLQTIGVDLAEHEVLRAAVLDLDGNILVRAERAIGDDTGQSVVDTVLDLVAETVAAATAPLLGIGIGTPGIVGPGGVVGTAPNLGWSDVPLRELVSAATGLPVFVVNDADAAGTAEVRFGAGAGRSGVIVVVTLGTGIGSALFVDGTLVPNTELGHLHLHHGDAEDWAADSARERDNLSWDEYAQRLERYLDMVQRLFWPNLIIVGGGISKKADKYLPSIRVDTEVVPATLLNNAGIVGAAMFAPEA